MHCLFCIALPFFSIYTACAETTIDSAKLLLVNQEYERAENILVRAMAKSPENMEPVYLFLAVEQTRVLDYESYNIEAETFDNRCISTLAILNKALPLKKGRDNLDCSFYIGSTYGGMSLMQAKVGSWPMAVKSGLSSLNYYKKVIKTDPSYYPAYLGIGVFNYYISQNLKWIPFFGDKKNEGLEQIRTATKSGFPYSVVARNSLCWILAETGQLSSADSVASVVLKDLPNNTIFIRLKARIALWKKDWPQAIFWSKKLVLLSEKRMPVNWSDLFSGYQIQIASYDALSKKRICLDMCRKVLSKTVPDPYNKIPYVKKHQKFIADIQKKYSGQ